MHKEDDQFDSEEGARPSSLRPVHKLSTPDPLYDQQLLRDLAIINERTRKELGPPPHRAEPVQAKRKPNLPSEGESVPVPDRSVASIPSVIASADDSDAARLERATADDDPAS